MNTKLFYRSLFEFLYAYRLDQPVLFLIDRENILKCFLLQCYVLLAKGFRVSLGSNHTSSSIDEENSCIGQIKSLSGTKAVIQLNSRYFDKSSKFSDHLNIGAVIKTKNSSNHVVGIVSKIEVDDAQDQCTQDFQSCIAEVEFIGELQNNVVDKGYTFSRGVTLYPNIGDLFYLTTQTDMEIIYNVDAENAISVGHLPQDKDFPVKVKIDELLGKHFAILGTTGTGKSCTVALVFQEILKQNPYAHILLLDPHDEYASAFKEQAEIITLADLHLPYWSFSFEEIIEILIGDKKEHKTEVEILSELIPLAKAKYNSKGRDARQTVSLRKSDNESVLYSVDTPVPYRLSDLVSLLDDRMGKLDHKSDIWACKQLKQRIASLKQDKRYAFMFGSFDVQDHMKEVLGRIFRIPVNNKPIAILQLGGLPSEVINVVVSILCRMAFDFGLWNEGKVPITLVCEEAHRYIPVDKNSGFIPTRRSISRIAKEGRKYGISLCIVSQRPGELDPTILSQCNTVIAMRLANENDQNIISSAVSDASSSLLRLLSSLGNREVIAFGDGVSLPTRIKLNELDPDTLPKGQTASFTERWRDNSCDEYFLNSLVNKWRSAICPAGAQGAGTGGNDQRRANLGPEYRGLHQVFDK